MVVVVVTATSAATTKPTTANTQQQRQRRRRRRRLVPDFSRLQPLILAPAKAAWLLSQHVARLRPAAGGKCMRSRAFDVVFGVGWGLDWDWDWDGRQRATNNSLDFQSLVGLLVGSLAGRSVSCCAVSALFGPLQSLVSYACLLAVYIMAHNRNAYTLAAAIQRFSQPASQPAIESLWGERS